MGLWVSSHRSAPVPPRATRGGLDQRVIHIMRITFNRTRAMDIYKLVIIDCAKSVTVPCLICRFPGLALVHGLGLAEGKFVIMY